MKPRYLSSRDAAAYLGLSLDQLKRLTSARAIPFHKVNDRCNRYDIDELDQFMRERRIETETG